MKKGDTRRKYAPEFKQDALELAEKIGWGPERSEWGNRIFCLRTKLFCPPRKRLENQSKKCCSVKASDQSF